MRSHMITMPAVLSLALAGCPKKDATPEAAADAPAAPAADAGVARDMPSSLPLPAFSVPPTATATLSNGLTVQVFENHEVPTFTAMLALRLPDQPDPAGKRGATSMLFDLMDEGAGGRDAVTLGRTLKTLGGGVGSGAGRDYASVRVSGPVRNLDGLLDIWADVLLRPDLPADEWEVLQSRRVADLKAAYDDPNAVAGRAGAVVAYGDRYVGALATPASLGAVALKDLKALHKKLVRPERAVLMVGGDLTLDALVPALEARLAKWKTPDKTAFKAPDATMADFGAETVYLVDQPGAAQSVVRAYLPVPDRTDEAWWSLSMANTMFGGAFTARVNMNLREDKGWTYGARCGIDDHIGEALWYCSTNVQTDKTAPALAELRAMLADSVGPKPFTDDEVAYFQGYEVNGFYSAFETPSSLVGEMTDEWLHGLPTDWLERFVPSIQGVTAASANATWTSTIDPTKVAWLVVGDLDKVQAEIEALGVPVVVLDADGRPVE